MCTLTSSTLSFILIITTSYHYLQLKQRREREFVPSSSSNPSMAMLLLPLHHTHTAPSPSHEPNEGKNKTKFLIYTFSLCVAGTKCFEEDDNLKWWESSSGERTKCGRWKKTALITVSVSHRWFIVNGKSRFRKYFFFSPHFHRWEYSMRAKNDAHLKSSRIIRVIFINTDSSASPRRAPPCRSSSWAIMRKIAFAQFDREI